MTELPTLSKLVLHRMRAGLQTAYYSIGNKITFDEYEAGMNHLDALEAQIKKKEQH